MQAANDDPRGDPELVGELLNVGVSAELREARLVAAWDELVGGKGIRLLLFLLCQRFFLCLLLVLGDKRLLLTPQFRSGMSPTPASRSRHKLWATNGKEAEMKRYPLWAAATLLAAVLLAPPSAAAPPGSASIIIRHQLRGCHTWSLNGGAYRAELDVRLAPGGTLTITNTDLMVQKLIRERGPAVRMKAVVHEHMKTVGLHRITGPAS